MGLLHIGKVVVKTTLDDGIRIDVKIPLLRGEKEHFAEDRGQKDGDGNHEPERRAEGEEGKRGHRKQNQEHKGNLIEKDAPEIPRRERNPLQKPLKRLFGLVDVGQTERKQRTLRREQNDEHNRAEEYTENSQPPDKEFCDKIGQYAQNRVKRHSKEHGRERVDTAPAEILNHETGKEPLLPGGHALFDELDEGNFLQQRDEPPHKHEECKEHIGERKTRRILEKNTRNVLRRLVENSD